VELLGREGIRTLPLKGPTLAVAAYGNLALREFVDLDLLVRREDALRSRQVLIKKGYIPVLQLNAKWEEAYMRAYDEFGLCGPDGHSLVELHWAITPRYFSCAPDIGQYWERATSVNLGGRNIPTLVADDLLLVLCLHAAKHCWPRLSMVSDVAWLMTACDIHWDDVLKRAAGLGALRMVLLGAELAGSLLEVPLPEAVVRSAADERGVHRLLTGVATRVTPASDSQDSQSLLQNILSAGRFHIQARERWRDRIRYFFRLATTAGVEDWEFVDLPRWLAFLYPPLRFPRLLRKYWMQPRNANGGGSDAG
jgi:putative nucleotidyltransferase-like protein